MPTLIVRHCRLHQKATDVTGVQTPDGLPRIRMGLHLSEHKHLHEAILLDVRDPTYKRIEARTSDGSIMLVICRGSLPFSATERAGEGEKKRHSPRNWSKASFERRPSVPP